MKSWDFEKISEKKNETIPRKNQRTYATYFRARENLKFLWLADT